jgi:hypothetical protein
MPEVPDVSCLGLHELGNNCNFISDYALAFSCGLDLFIVYRPPTHLSYRNFDLFRDVDRKGNKQNNVAMLYNYFSSSIFFFIPGGLGKGTICILVELN